MWERVEALCQVLGRDFLNHASLLGVGLFLFSYKNVKCVFIKVSFSE